MSKIKRICKSIFVTKIIDINDTEARDNLANERTFLAWLRTAFATAAVGILLGRIQLSNGETFSKILSLSFVIIGFLCVIAGASRYAHIQIYLEQKKYPTTGIIVSLITFMAFISFVATFIWIIL